MNHTIYRQLRLVLVLGLGLILFQCGRDRHDPVSAGKGDEGIRLTIRLAKSVTSLNIDKVRVVAKNPSRSDSVNADLVIDTVEKKATGSLSVPAGTGWVITAYAFVGSHIFYQGTSLPVDVIAGQTTAAVNITLDQAVADLVIGRGIYFTKRPGDTQPLASGTILDGDSITVNLDYRNTGPVDATDWRYELYLDSQLYRFDEASISGSKSGVLFVPWVAVAGSHTFEWKLDTNNQVVELDDTGNNTATLTTTVLQRADLLVVGQIFFTQPNQEEPLNIEEIVEGNAVDVNLYCQNAGPVDATGWRFEIYLDGGFYGSGDGIPLPANSTKLARLFIPWVAVADRHVFEFRVDPNNQIKESDESNNIASLTFTIKAAPSVPKLDLVADEVYFTRPGETQHIAPDAITEGDSLDVKVDYKNEGSEDASGWRVEIHMDGQLAGSADGQFIAANAEETLSYAWIATAGPHTFEWRLDTTDQVRETDEANNAKSVTVVVRAAPTTTQGIIAGKGVDRVQIGMSGDDVIGILGQPDTIDSENGIYDYTASLGLTVQLDGQGNVFVITTFPPYSGSTERGVKLGDSAVTVVQQYGANYDRTEFEGGGGYTYDYTGLGISFGFDQTDVCIFIGVYPPSASAKIMRATP